MEAKPKPPAPRAAAAAPAALMDDAIDLSSLVAAERTAQGHVAEGLRCPSCKANLPAGTQLCTMCAWDFKRGRPSPVAKPVESKAAPSSKYSRSSRSSSSSGGGIGKDISVAGVGMLLLGVLFFVALGNPSAAVGFYAVFILYALCCQILLIMTPFGEGSTGWGMLAVASLIVPFLGFAMLYYAFAVTDRASLKYWVLGTILGSVGMAVLYAQHNGVS